MKKIYGYARVSSREQNLDRQLIADVALNGYATPAYSENDGMPWNNPAVKIDTNVEYAKKTVVDAFRKKGFTLKKLYDYTPTAEEVDRFCMVGYTKLEDEKEKRYEIKFSILNDGTVVTDSNYLPDDVNEMAHAAMDDLQEAFGNKRIMTKKPEYDIMIARLKEHKKITNKNTQKIK